MGLLFQHVLVKKSILHIHICVRNVTVILSLSTGVDFSKRLICSIYNTSDVIVCICKVISRHAFSACHILT